MADSNIERTGCIALTYIVVCAIINLHQASALIWECELKMSGLLCQGSLVRLEGHGMIPHAVPFFFYTFSQAVEKL